MLSHGSGKSVLFIITDQQRYDAVGYKSSFLKTPNIDKLSSESITFDRVYVQSPQCQPSRASIFTGRYPTAHKVWWNSINLPTTEITIGNIFRNTHKTAFFGKAHFNDDDKLVIKKFGFDHDFLFCDWCALNNRTRTDENPKSDYYRCMEKSSWCGKLRFSSDLYHDDIVTDKAIEWIKNYNEQFLAVVSFINPHPPYAAPFPYSEMYSAHDFDKPKGNCWSINGKLINDSDWDIIKSQYYGNVSLIDYNVGRLLECVGDDVIVVFTSDHGDILGDHNLFSKGLYAYEGNTRVPLILKNKEMGPSKYNHIVQSIDILPTLCNMVGISTNNRMQGRNLTKAIENNRKTNDYALSMIGHSDRIRMIVNNQFKYWKYLGKDYLFDLVNDPGENANINDQKLINEMRGLLLDALIKAEDPAPHPG